MPGGSDAVHELEHVFVLGVDPQPHFLAFGVEPGFQFAEGDAGLLDIDHHDHDEEFVHHGLRDIEDVGTGVGQYRRNVGDDADTVLADDGDDDAVGIPGHGCGLTGCGIAAEVRYCGDGYLKRGVPAVDPGRHRFVPACGLPATGCDLS